jgi:two-component system nitrogen regulation response regulator NtrX
VNIELKHLPGSIAGMQSGTRARQAGRELPDAGTFREAKEEFEKIFLLKKLEENDWNVSRTAEAIEIERSNLHRKIKSFGIELKK